MDIRAFIQSGLESPEVAQIDIPAGQHVIIGELEIKSPIKLTSTQGGSVRFDLAARECGFRVLSGDVSIIGLDIELNVVEEPGPHDGEFGTAFTLGRYFYDAPVSAYIDGILLRDIKITRTPSSFPANTIFGGGAIRNILVEDIDISGGLLGVGFHWGAVGTGVRSVTGPSYHPNTITVRNLKITDSVEGFWASSCYDISFENIDVTGAEMLFRTLPGDNGDLFTQAFEKERVMHGVRISNIRGHALVPHLFAVRITGWGKSPIDGSEIVFKQGAQEIENISISCAGTPDPRFGLIFLDRCHNVSLRDVVLEGASGSDMLKLVDTSQINLAGFTSR